MEVEVHSSANPGDIARVLNQSLTADSRSPVEILRKVLLDPNFDRRGSLLACPPVSSSGDESVVNYERAGESTGVGYCLAIARRVPLENADDDSHRGYITLFGVAPGHRRQGIGCRLLEGAESFLRADGRREVWISPYAPNYFTPGVDVGAYAEGLEFLKRRGYEEVYRPLSMECDLRSLTAPPLLEEKRRLVERDGFGFSPLIPAQIVRLLEFSLRVFKGDWCRLVREVGYRYAGENTERIWIAYRKDSLEIVGFSHHLDDRFGPIGVDPEVRGRGIGQILTWLTLQSQVREGNERGYFMWSDDRTAERLYNHFGFKEARRFAILKKEL